MTPVTENKVQSCNCEVTERCYHLKIKFNSDDYFYTVKTLNTHTEGHQQIITEIHRGTAWWDCQKKLKNSEKKAIKKLIEKYFNDIIF